MLFLVFFTHDQSIYFDHKNMIFVYFSLVFFTYLMSFLVALFLEYPFRTMAKVVFSPPKKILRLNRELARELNTNIDNLFNDSDDDLDSNLKQQEQLSEQQYTQSETAQTNNNSGTSRQNSKNISLLQPVASDVTAHLT